MKILGVGLSKTGTMSLHHALQLLGFTSLHYDTKRLNPMLSGTAQAADFRCYDDVDAVTDLPAALFYKELLAAYPDAVAILTTRDIESWWCSIREHCNEEYPVPLHKAQSSWSAEDRFRNAVRNRAYGSAVAEEKPYKKRFMEHNAAVQSEIPAHRLLVMDIMAGDGWEKLCPFLGVAIPDAAFPHSNKSGGVRKTIRKLLRRL